MEPERRVGQATWRAAGTVTIRPVVDQNDLNVRGMPRASRNGSLPQCPKIEIPFSVASSDDNARDFVVPMIGVNQIAVRTVGQVFIAKMRSTSWRPSTSNLGLRGAGHPRKGDRERE